MTETFKLYLLCCHFAGIVTLDEHNQTIETEKIYPKWVVSGKESETVSVMDTVSQV